MKRRLFFLLILSVAMASFVSIGSVRKALLFDTQIAYAANEPWYGWMNMNGEEVQIQFETSLTSREISVKEFCKIYGFSNISGTSVIEQWCHQKDNSMCEMRFVGAFLNNNGVMTRLTVVPEYMYY
ncbi:MAG: hypothetical protein MJY68_06000 [Bacteroidaceae bacterium]|nr:hypothetical protein [Bacteroidaceae bacterium]